MGRLLVSLRQRCRKKEAVSQRGLLTSVSTATGSQLDPDATSKLARFDRAVRLGEGPDWVQQLPRHLAEGVAASPLKAAAPVSPERRSAQVVHDDYLPRQESD
jgi:hypothetical protein